MPSIAWSLLGGCLGAPGLDGAADPKHVLGVTVSTGCVSYPQAQGGSAVSLGGLCSLPEHGWERKPRSRGADPDWQSPGGTSAPGGFCLEVPARQGVVGCCAACAYFGRAGQRALLLLRSVSVVHGTRVVFLSLDEGGFFFF